MAFFNDLVRAIAVVEGMDEMTVRGIGIRIRDGGFISKGGRGLSAAKMTSKDAAALLIGVNACTSATSAAEILEKYQSLKLSDVYPSRAKMKGGLRHIISERNNLMSLVTELFELCVPTIGRVDLFGHVFSNGLMLGKEVRSRFEAGENFDEVIRTELSLVRPQLLAVFEAKCAKSGEILLRATYGDYDRRSQVDRRDVTTVTQVTIRALSAALYAN
ncbi:hypothetical protein [Methylorubrum extorquens]|uniref:Uncharacterized protein n=1 Tax=Methylorubrum extorquens (strain CM4 / NCIMB 13688) TaxID=440085 RepID=B7KTU7_METC4|nr:hypothetical protein [Methylorubrum extorquens]ACK84157.1 hypothetical protein Mchl_3322 [Methylorubrum extorquens CM4]